MNKAFLGKWKITEMELWDDNGYIRFDEDGNGEFEFGVVYGHMRCGYGQNTVDFKWEGNAECDEARGEGWAELDEGSTNTLTGSIEFWDGDESEFKARKL